MSRPEPPAYDEGVAVCPNCGWVEHTSEEMVECLKALVPGPSCVLCGREIVGHGHNAEPAAAGRCCDDCQRKVVIPTRFMAARDESEPCQRGTVGCSIDHGRTNGPCETW